MQGRILGLIYTHSVKIALLSLLCVFTAGWGVQYLHLNTHYTNFFEPDDPRLLAHTQLESDYNNSDNISFLIRQHEGDIFNRETLQAINRLTQGAWKLPYALSVTSLTTHKRVQAEGDEISSTPLIDLNASSLDKHDIKNYVLSTNSLIRHVVSVDGTMSRVNVSIGLPKADREAVGTVTLAARELARKIEMSMPSIQIEVSGQVAFNWAFREVTQQDARTVIPFSVLMIGVLIYACFRSLVAVWMILTSIIATSVTTLGIAGWLNVELNEVSLMASVIIMTIAVADCVHLLADTQRNYHSGLPQKLAVRTALAANFYPTLLTSLTTAAGFLSLNFSNAPPFRLLGNLAAGGAIIAWILVYATFPVWCRLLNPARLKPGLLARWLTKVPQLITVQLPMKIVLLALAIIAILCLQASRNSVDDHLLHYLDDSVPIRTAVETFAHQLGGFDRIGWSFTATESINDPEYISQLQNFTDHLRSLPQVVSVISYADVMQEIDAILRSDLTTGVSRDLYAQYQLIYIMGLDNPQQLNDLINLTGTATRVYATFIPIESQALMQLNASIQQWLAENAPLLRHPGGSVSLLFNEIGLENSRSMMQGNLIMILCISLFLMALFRSVKLGFIALFPNVLPALLVLGLWGWFDGEVNLAVAAIFCLTLGIVVDDTVHLICKYQACKAMSLHSQSRASIVAMQTALNRVASPIAMTSIILIGGFSILMLSNLLINWTLGLMISLTIGVALLFDLFLLPSLIVKLDGANSDQALTSSKANTSDVSA